MVAKLEKDIWSRLLEEWDNLDPAAARGILQLKFGKPDVTRMNKLAARARAGNLTEARARRVRDLHGSRSRHRYPTIKSATRIEAQGSSSMNDALKLRVRGRARHKCEYCRLPEWTSLLPHQIDHVIARKHGGKTEISNLTLAC